VISGVIIRVLSENVGGLACRRNLIAKAGYKNHFGLADNRWGAYYKGKGLRRSQSDSGEWFYTPRGRRWRIPGRRHPKMNKFGATVLFLSKTVRGALSPRRFETQITEQKRSTGAMQNSICGGGAKRAPTWPKADLQSLGRQGNYWGIFTGA